MKKSWLVLLSLGLVMAFSVSAFAVDVKVSGEYYAAGMYLNKVNLKDYDGSTNPSTAFFFQRLRVGTDFIVSPSLKLVTRFDAMERIWGGTRSTGTYLADNSAGTLAENQNIAFDLAYVQYASPIGAFAVGYQDDGKWGTVFGDSSIPRGAINWSLKQGSLTYLAQIVKIDDESASAVNTGVSTTDLDADKYAAGIIYNWKDGEAGARLIFLRNANYKNESYPDASLINAYHLQPYVKTKIGPVAIQAELNYTWGDEKGEDGGTKYNAKYEAINLFVDAAASFNMFYVGGTFAYLSGDDPATTDKIEGGGYVNYYSDAYGGGTDWNPCLIMFNYDVLYRWAGGIYGYNYDAADSWMNNALFFQGRVGMKPTPQWDVMLSLSYAQADRKPQGNANGAYGTEVDVTGTYKITNNLSYMLGFGYLFTGDFFKGADTDSSYKVNDDFLVINKLTLSF